MGFAVFHPEKGTGSGGGIGHHIDRTPGLEHTYPHADPARRTENINFSLQNGMHKLSIPEAIKKRIEEGYSGKKAIRKDAVKFLSLVMSGSHEDMKQLASNPKEFKAWQKANFDFVAREFGESNILRFTLHMDEKTPHIHAIVVPLTHDGRLSAKEIMGNKKTLSERQDRYAAQMEPYGLIRGVVGSKARHTGEGWYLAQQKEAQETPKIDALPTFGLMDRLDPAKYEKAVKTVVKTLQREAFEVKLDNRRRIEQVRDAQVARQKSETGAALQREAVESLAQQLVLSGQEGIKLNATYALLNGPKALKQASYTVFTREVKKLADIHLKPITEQCYRDFHGIQDNSKATKEQYNELLQRDHASHRDIMAKEAINRLNHGIKERWGVVLKPESGLYKELKQKAVDFLRDAAQTITQELKKVLGINTDKQKKRGLGM